MSVASNLKEILNVGTSVLSTIEEYRVRIRETDKRLLSLMQERFSLGSKLAELKETNKLPVIDANAEQAVMDNLAKTSADLGFSASFARRLGEFLIEESVRAQESDRPKQSKDLLLKEVFEITQKLLAQGIRVTRFEIGEPNFPPSPQVIRGLTETFRKKKIIGYGPAAGLLELRRTLAEELSAQHGVEVEPDQILITPGGRFAIFAAITSYLSPLERVIIPQPAWPAYEECVDFVKGRVMPINTRLENGWELDLERLESEMKNGARLLVLNTPNNPTGKVIGKKRFDEIVALARKHGTMILSDEVYEKYVHAPAPSILESEHEDYVYINSFSKQFSLTGWRIAYLVTTKERANRIKRVIQTAVTCVPEFIQRAALTAVKKDRREAQRNINDILRKVELTCHELEKIDVSFYKPEGAFYVFPRVDKPSFDSVKFARRPPCATPRSYKPRPRFRRLPNLLQTSSLTTKSTDTECNQINRQGN